MAHFESMPEHSRMRDLLMRFPEKGAVLMSLGELFLRGTSELSHAEKEILFAYGSALNNCSFCHLSHKYTASELGVDESAFDQLLVSIDDAPIDERLKPLVRFVQKLTLTPSLMIAADVASVRAAGWTEDAIFDAICICGFSNLMNRVVDATGIVSTEEELRESGQRLASLGYDGTMSKARGPGK
ncbi:MAG: hypothetical protein QOE09_940 [Ilumatobacteraceae bacterium]